MRTLLWFRGKDLRLIDHAAVHQACTSSRELTPVFVLSPRYFRGAGPSSAPHRMQFLLDSLLALSRAIAERGSELQVVEGPATTAIPRLAAELKVERVLAMASCEPASRRRDARIQAELRVPFYRYEHETLTVPGSLRTVCGAAFQVYTAFSRAVSEWLQDSAVLSAPDHFPALPKQLDSVCVKLPSLTALGLAHNPCLQSGGEPNAQARLADFARGPASRYDVDRHRMDRAGTSRVSADLHFGTLSIRNVWHDVSTALDGRQEADALRRYRAELLWREFAHHTLVARPELVTRPFRAEFEDFPWRDDDAGFDAWRHGVTGYPVVDAAARQLLLEGFVHNRARLIAASFLIKHLLVSYQRGEAHYMRYLTDGDVAQNNLGWQWCAGSGCDALPFFRIFSPVKQGARCDPDGRYVRRFVPELARLPTRYVHAPWLAPASVLADAGVILGENYPRPIVDHVDARRRYLAVAGEHLKGARPERTSQRLRTQRVDTQLARESTTRRR
jgi:deoxyribodipyrimidine photo-lyase